MSRYYITKKDIRNKNGILLLSKNQRVTDRDLKKLRKFGRLDLKNSSEIKPKSSDSIPETFTTEAINSFGIRKHIVNEHILEKPNKVLNTIIFKSKDEPWWININALMNYASWLYTHSIDVAMMSLIMAVESGYGEQQLFDIGLGAFLHDIGMLLLPKSILEKSEALSETEKLIFRQHCELGASSLESYKLPKECIDIILQHHEQLDGNGYPKGLKEDEICLNSQIVMIADTVDRMTSTHPGKEDAYEMDEAIRIIKNEHKVSYELISLLERILH
jgi:putative nucleotidyltransferase with HDIG domain